jgi:hypothetical protein
MAELKKIDLLDIVADARELGGQEYVDLLYRVGPGKGPPPEQDWRLHVTFSDGSVVTMSDEATATDLAKVIEWERTRRR